MLTNTGIYGLAGIAILGFAILLYCYPRQIWKAVKFLFTAIGIMIVYSFGFILWIAYCLLLFIFLAYNIIGRKIWNWKHRREMRLIRDGFNKDFEGLSPIS